jgi:hypothetical protein
MAVRTVARLCTALLACAVVELAVASNALAATYEYAGLSFSLIIDQPVPAGATYSTANSVTGTVTIAGAPLAPNTPLTDVTANFVTWTLSDGVNTHTESNSTLVGPVLVATDGAGNISEWSIGTQVGALLSPGDQLEQITTAAIAASVNVDRGLLRECVTSPSPGVCSSWSTDIGQINNNPGIWTLIPEPSTALLLASGLVGVAGARTRRR